MNEKIREILSLPYKALEGILSIFNLIGSSIGNISKSVLATLLILIVTDMTKITKFNIVGQVLDIWTRIGLITIIEQLGLNGLALILGFTLIALYIAKK